MIYLVVPPKATSSAWHRCAARWPHDRRLSACPPDMPDDRSRRRGPAHHV